MTYPNQWQPPPTRGQERRADRIVAGEEQRKNYAAQQEQNRLNASAAAEQRRKDQEIRRNRRKAAFAKLRQAGPELGMSALWATMIGLPLLLVWEPQQWFAENILRISPDRSWGWPAVVECAVWLCAFEAHRRIKNAAPDAVRPAGILPWCMWLLAGFASSTNVVHGLADGSLAQAYGLGALSLIGVVLHSIRQRLDSRQRQLRKRDRREQLLLVWRWVRYPILCTAAASIRARQDTDRETAWTLAWMDRFGVGPESTRRERKLGKRVLRKTWRDDKKAAKNGGFVVVGSRLQQALTVPVQQMIDAERQAAMDRALEIQNQATDVLTAAGMLFGPDVLNQDGSNPYTEAEQAEDDLSTLSARAVELLEPLIEAIQAGEVEPQPSVNVIRRWVASRGERLGLDKRCGTPTAQELRDRVRDVRPRLHSVENDAGQVA